MTPAISVLPDHIRMIDDTHLGRPHVIATYLLLGDEPALVDPGPTSTLATLEAGVVANGLTMRDLSAILLTHIHLDHAGASGTLVARYPHLRVYVHHRGAPHMIAPERLIRSASRLYGAEMDTLWGEFRAVPEDHLTVLHGGETVRLGRRSVRVFDAPGHASHHVVYFEEASGVVFVGDNGGIRLPMMAHPSPATPPPDIDLEAWNRTLDTIGSLEPQLLLLTHFGPSPNPPEHIAEYRRRLAQWAEFVRSEMHKEGDEAAHTARLQALADSVLSPDITEADRIAFHQAAPIDQCWQGLVRYWQKRGP